MPGALWTHDDSGGDAALTLVSADGTVHGTSPLDGASLFDWEGAAAGPCPDGVAAPWCLFVGDIGDNRAERPFVTVYVVPEPAPGERATVARRWELTWPGGPRNAEALLVHPCTGAVDLVEKASSGRSLVARVPPGLGDGRARMVPLGTLEIPGATRFHRWVTGGTWDAAGQRVVLRTYTHLLVYTAADATPWTASTPTLREGPGEFQGEAVVLLDDGTLVTTSEGRPLVLSTLACRAPAPEETCPSPSPTPRPAAAPAIPRRP